MSDRKIANKEVAIIHPRALQSLGLKASLTMLEVAHDLREGKIECLNMRHYLTEGAKCWANRSPALSENECGTPMCIWGHVATRLGYSQKKVYAEAKRLVNEDVGLSSLFAANNPSDHKLAANAIENYVLKGFDEPWDM